MTISSKEKRSYYGLVGGKSKIFPGIREEAARIHKKSPFHVHELNSWFQSSALAGNGLGHKGPIESMRAHRVGCMELYRIISTRLTTEVAHATGTDATSPSIFHAFVNGMPLAMESAPLFDIELLEAFRKVESRGEACHTIRFILSEPNHIRFFASFKTSLADLQNDVNFDIVDTTHLHSITTPEHALIVPALNAIGLIFRNMVDILNAVIQARATNE